jgi:ABC-type multidrug transport system permease subunit
MLIALSLLLTVQGIGGLFVTLTVLFSGILRPDMNPTFWIFMYWITPGHYIFEGIIMSQYDGDDTPITASAGSAFYSALNCQPSALYWNCRNWVTSFLTGTIYFL